MAKTQAPSADAAHAAGTALAEAGEALLTDDGDTRPPAGRAVEHGAAFVRRLAVAELAEGIAHDLKNQLTVVAASVQLARGVADGGRKDLLDRAWRAAMRAAQLMDEMLSYTHGGVGAEHEADAAEALETAVAGAWGYCGARGVQLEMRRDDGLPRVAGSPPALRVLLLHLLRWVADRCPPEGRLIAEASGDGGGVTIRMRFLDQRGRAGLLRPPADTTAPAGDAIESAAVLQALADQAGVRLAHKGAWPELFLQASTGPSRQWEGGLGVHGLREGSGAADLGRDGEN